MLHRSLRYIVVTAALALGAQACSDTTSPDDKRPAILPLYSITPATVRSLVVRVTGPGISPDLIVNIPVDTLGVARGDVAVLPGSPRNLTVTAVDTSGIVSHRADTTLRLIAGANPTLSLVLRPLTATAPIVVTFGSLVVTITNGPTTPRVGDTATFAATVAGGYGPPVSPDSIGWASSDPSVVLFVGARATATRAGTTTVTASFHGAAATRIVTVGPASAVAGTFLIEQKPPSCCEQLALFQLPSAVASLVIPQNSGQGDLSPNKAEIAFWRPFDNRIFRSAFDGSGVVVISSGTIQYTPRWSFASTQITLTREVGGGANSREIFIMNRDGSALTQLTSNGSSDEQAHLSPDGTRIVFSSTRDGNDEVYLMNSDGSNQVRLTNAPGSDGEPSWSPDGTRIAFTSDRSGAAEIWTMAPDGTALFQVTTGSASNLQIARWSYDGLRLSYVRTVGGSVGAWTIRPDGTDPQQLRPTPAGITYEFVRSWRAP